MGSAGSFFPMRLSASPFVLAALFAVVGAPQASGEQKTVCTITVNSPDEKEAFRRALPPDTYRFVELVERGRALRCAHNLGALRWRSRVLLGSNGSAGISSR